MSVELSEVTNAVAEFDRVAAGLAELQSKYKGVVYDVASPKGMKEAIEARREIRTPRLEVERIRKAAKAPILELGRKLDSEAQRITKALLAIEEPVDAAIKAEEARKEREKQEKIELEMRRVAALHERVAELRGCQTLTASSGSELIAGHIADLEKLTVDDSFEEFRQQAEDAKVAGLSRLRDLHAAALAHEAEHARIQAEREELARLRAEQARREAEERARIAEEERQARIAREAEAARQAEQLRRQREEEAAAAAARQAIIDAENARIRSEQEAERKRIAEESARLAAERAESERKAREAREAQEAEERRIAAERAALEREQREAREAEERKAREQREREETEAAAERKRLERRKLMETRSRPDSDAIVQVVADAFDVDQDIAAGWLYETPKTAWKNLTKREAA